MSRETGKVFGMDRSKMKKPARGGLVDVIRGRSVDFEGLDNGGPFRSDGGIGSLFGCDLQPGTC
ncbi:hypothetical protein ACKZDW_02490 (plasmid) [Ralstonia syzygii subsp. celebesensis]